MPVVAVSRAILGAGAGFMFAVPLGLFAVSLPDELRPRAFGINAAMWGVSALIGPALGAVLTATVGWRWVFWINLPLIAVVAWSAARALRGIQPRERSGSGRRLNIAGPVLLGLVVAVLLALTKHWLPPLVLAPLALVPAIGFFLHERRTSQPVFTHTANSIAANVAAFGAGVAFLGAETYLPLQLQVGFGDGVRVVGVALPALHAGVDDRVDDRRAPRSAAAEPDRARDGPDGGGHLRDGDPRRRCRRPDRGLHVLGAGDGDREPRAVRGGAGRRRGGPRGPIDVEHPARHARSDPGWARRSPASCSRRRSRRPRCTMPSAPVPTCPRSSTPPA